MKILNLAYPEKSEIKFTISRFPDGQQDLTLLPYSEQPYAIMDDEVCIFSRFNSFKDLELIICATKVLRRSWRNLSIKLYIPYLLGARSDRQFQEGGTSYLVDVVAPILNSLNFKEIEVLDIHSDVAAACIPSLRSTMNKGLVRSTIDILYGRDNRISEDPNFVLISPDSGATKKMYTLAKLLEFKGSIVTCSKNRGTDGKLSHTAVPIYQEHNNKDCIIIDDICDGGATFVNIAKEIKKGAFKGKLYLIVTHGIFSKGYAELLNYFDAIYCTNSYSDFRAFEDSDTKYLNKINHLNVF